MLLLLILFIVGLTVGLVIGLGNRRNNSSNNGASSPSAPTSPARPASNTTFPAGSYAIDTFLDTVGTNCTSNPATWRCYPYSTYTESPGSSAATFDWIIQPASSGSSTYTVSSTNNPFSLVFANATMTLVDANLATERYTFEVTMNKPVVPMTAITTSNVAATCYFNSTTFAASLYTRMAMSFGSNSTSNSTGNAFAPWPYAASMEQVATSGSTVPECYDAQGNLIGNFTVESSGRQCNCLYMNYDT